MSPSKYDYPMFQIGVANYNCNAQEMPKEEFLKMIHDRSEVDRQKTKEALAEYFGQILNR